ncbi:hypothetical protein FQN60_000546 [Scomber scombrus]|uniref:Uncharacterized protein n=1 Tax=Scomber scombrus TaxID=13677 RepID=A0AAV1NCH7_SCOSC
MWRSVVQRNVPSSVTLEFWSPCPPSSTDKGFRITSRRLNQQVTSRCAVSFFGWQVSRRVVIRTPDK